MQATRDFTVKTVQKVADIAMHNDIPVGALRFSSFFRQFCTSRAI
jgi:hypothetical protein